MKCTSRLLLAACTACATGQATTSETVRWQEQARNVTITRDDWGIPHIHGKTDADAVFGMIYAQAEDDFNRIEVNYLNAMGRLAEAVGDSAVIRDLRMKLYINPDTLKAKFAASPDWLKSLMVAWADGLNYFLSTHPRVVPRVLKRFEPWMALSFSEGSIGGDIESISLRGLRAFYGGQPADTLQPGAEPPPSEPSGSNGIAIAPANTTAHHALLLINPHTSFFFRAELQVQSDEGLNAYGAVTWGQFFVYQGFNERVGWMHTSSGADNIDEYLETPVRQNSGFVYRYSAGVRRVTTSTITVPYRQGAGMASRTFTVYGTHHGPVVREAGGKWVSVRLMDDPVHALIQSYTRTKAGNYQAFRETMELHTNSSNNTVYADADGNIALFHSNFMPRRDPRQDWSKPVDGSDPATEWGPLFSVEETPLIKNPATGWLYNSNDAPWWAAGPDSPKQADYPKYVDPEGANQRTPHAIRVLENRKDFTLASLISAAYDSYLPTFATLIPSLLQAYDGLPDSSRTGLAEPIAELRKWDYRWSTGSVATTLAVYWGTEASRRDSAGARSAGMDIDKYIVERVPAQRKLDALRVAVARLTADFGSWKTAWGEVNRFQRLSDDIVHPFDDAKPSIPVGFTSARWGSLASFGARSSKGSKKLYGTSGNSFVAVVEFGDSVRARAVTAGGQSGNPASPHFNDQAARYSTGDLREVYFYPSQLKGHIERSYHPGG
ncbi:MAG TPA: penicillin acylase family protein [Gemmatimonadales bacterium]